MKSSSKVTFQIPSPLHEMKITPKISNLASEYEIYKNNNRKLECIQENQLQTVPVRIYFNLIFITRYTI